MDTFDQTKSRHEVSAPFQGDCVGSKAMYNQAREDRGFLLAVIAAFDVHCVAASDVDIAVERTLDACLKICAENDSAERAANDIRDYRTHITGKI